MAARLRFGAAVAGASGTPDSSSAICSLRAWRRRGSRQLRSARCGGDPALRRRPCAPRRAPPLTRRPMRRRARPGRGAEQLIAPGDRCCSVCCVRSPGASRRSQRLRELRRDLRRSERLRARGSSIASGRPSSARQILARARRRPSARSRRSLQRALQDICTAAPERRCRSRRPAGTVARPQICSPRRRSGVRLVASTRRRGAARPLRDEQRSVEQMLKVVEHEQQLAVAHERPGRRRRHRPHRRGAIGRPRPRRRSATGRELLEPDEQDAVGVRLGLAARHLEHEPGLATLTGPVSVTSWTSGSARRPPRAVTSSSRPTSRVGARGRFDGGLGAAGGVGVGAAAGTPPVSAWSASSRASIRCCRRTSGSPGSSPSSSASTLPGALERLERVGLATGAVEGEHQLPAQPLFELVRPRRVARARRRVRLPRHRRGRRRCAT